MHTDRVSHSTAFVTPVVKHCLEREIAKKYPDSHVCIKMLPMSIHMPMKCYDCHANNYLNIKPINEQHLSGDMKVNNTSDSLRIIQVTNVLCTVPVAGTVIRM